MEQVLDLDPASYAPHWLHGDDRLWRETNCATDLWIETLHALGRDPILGLGFTLGGDFDGEQWQMFTYPPETLRRIYGIVTDELNTWRPLSEHVEAHLRLGHLVVVDVDAFYLPDTVGLTYRTSHQKTSVMVQLFDVERRRLGYFHNTGYYELEGADFDGIFGVDHSSTSERLPPYAMVVRFDGARPSEAEARERALRLGLEHLEHRSTANPLIEMQKQLEEDLPWLRELGLEAFHRYAFGSLRQCGANAELAADYLARWQDLYPPAGGAGECLRTVAECMKTLEFGVARAVRGRTASVGQLFERPSAAWDEALRLLGRYG